MAPVSVKLAVDLANALSKLRLARKVRNEVEIVIAEDFLNDLLEQVPRDRSALR